jgi:hypothetical protein
MFAPAAGRVASANAKVCGWAILNTLDSSGGPCRRSQLRTCAGLNRADLRAFNVHLDWLKGLGLISEWEASATWYALTPAGKQYVAHQTSSYGAKPPQAGALLQCPGCGTSWHVSVTPPTWYVSVAPPARDHASVAVLGE